LPSEHGGRPDLVAVVPDLGLERRSARPNHRAGSAALLRQQYTVDHVTVRRWVQTLPPQFVDAAPCEPTIGG
jgi:hypothetical protein